MADLTVRCPGCEARLKVAATKTVARCPKCGTKVRVHDPAEEVDDPDVKRLLSRVKLIERVEEDEEDRPRARRRRRDEEEEEERPRRRRKAARQEEGDGPWLVAVLATAACFLVTFAG